MKRVFLTTLTSSYSFLCSQWHPVSPSVPSGLTDNVMNLFFSFPPSLFSVSHFFFLDKHFELYIGKYCIRLQYSCS